MKNLMIALVMVISLVVLSHSIFKWSIKVTNIRERIARLEVKVERLEERNKKC
jgi:hypothetical protein